MQLQTAKHNLLRRGDVRGVQVAEAVRSSDSQAVTIPIVMQASATGTRAFRAALTTRERDALTWAAAGKSAAAISVLMNISTSAVSAALARASTQLGCSSRAQAAYQAWKQGLLNEDLERLVGSLPAPTEGAVQLPQLSDSERTQLVWTSRGKTAWECSRISGLSEAYVSHLLQAAAEKLGATGKTHAVVKAAIWGLIE